ncbi:MAG: hypothetical protein LBR22_00330 [Desulfovibrio sp.]|nr:hypothetical protein [Desulfovibrio sp.]
MGRRRSGTAFGERLIQRRHGAAKHGDDLRHRPEGTRTHAGRRHRRLPDVGKADALRNRRPYSQVNHLRQEP